MLSYVAVKPYEIIEHTADIGVRGFGRTREELFTHLAQGMFSLMVPPEEIRATERTTVVIRSNGWDNLLISWLKDLLYLFDTRRFLGREFSLTTLEPNRLEAVVSGERLDDRRHHVNKEVKAVTYCDYRLEQDPSGLWIAQVIFDI